MLKSAIFAAFITISFAQRTELMPTSTNYEIIPLDKKERILKGTSPIAGSLSLVSLNMLWDTISVVWSAIGYKLTALSHLANGAYWVFNHCGPVLLVGGGLLALLGLCKISGLCNLDLFIEGKFDDTNESLVDAARNLKQGFLKYGNL